MCLGFYVCFFCVSDAPSEKHFCHFQMRSIVVWSLLSRHQTSFLLPPMPPTWRPDEFLPMPFHPLHLSSGDLEGSAFYGIGVELLHLAFNTCHNLSFSVPLWPPSLLPPALLCLVPLGQRTHPLCGLVLGICSYCSSLTSPPWIMLLFQDKASSERILCVCAGLSS